MMIRLQFVVMSFLLIALRGQTIAEDSLQGALEFVNQRQQILDNDVRNNYLNSDDLEELENRKTDLEMALLQYLQTQRDLENDGNRGQSSPFRERSEQSQHYKMLSNYRPPQTNADYLDLAQHSMRNEDPSEEAMEYAYKRAQSIYDPYYGNLGWNSVGLRKRMPYYPVTKRFPVSKRSSNIKEDIPSTDPRVERELQKIFNPPKQSETDKKVTPTKKPIEQIKKTAIKTTSQPEVNNATDVSSLNKEKPLDMKKKSIKWSDYFGIDRRKKSENMDNEWLLDRYHKANKITKKSNMIGGAPLKIAISKKDENASSRIDKLEEKLRDIEEIIIDDTLKFTGAFDDVDSKEMQEVKDSIIARLATAYNVEKMRKALEEYRDSLPKLEEKYSNQEKRVAIARKQAIDVDRSQEVQEDNHIKCTHLDEDCNEQNYKVPMELLESVVLEPGRCSWIERACREVLQHWGSHGEMFNKACHMHQMCMLCSDNSWFSPTRQCNVLFIAKADRLCEDDNDCQRAARDAVKYLQHVSRNIDMELISDCHLECPDKR